MKTRYYLLLLAVGILAACEKDELDRPLSQADIDNPAYSENVTVYFDEGNGMQWAPTFQWSFEDEDFSGRVLSDVTDEAGIRKIKLSFDIALVNKDFFNSPAAAGSSE